MNDHHEASSPDSSSPELSDSTAPHPPESLSGAPGGWTADEFRKAGHATIEWVARYLESVGDLPVCPSVSPGEITESLPKDAPSLPQEFDEILQDLDDVVVPGMTHWNHPGFLAYFGITSSSPGILAEMVAAAFNPNGMLWKTSPVSTELELHVLGWLRDMCGLPEDWFGFLLDTASMATFLALAGARQSIPNWDVRKDGLSGAPQLCVYASDQAHVSVEKAVIGLGIGQAGFRSIESDKQFRMKPDALRGSIRRDRAAGLVPCAVVATVGTTSSTSVDPVPEIARICEEESVWLHVDAAYAGSAAILPSKRPLFDGSEKADSYVFNPHKWLFVPIDATAFYTRHPDVLREAFGLVPDYLRSTDGGVNLMDYGLQLGRRFRALKIWWVIRSFGVSGIQSRIQYHCELAARFAEWVEKSDSFKLVAPVPFSVVCFRAVWRGLAPAEEDARNEALAEQVTAEGRAFLATTSLAGRIVLRVAIGNIRTDEKRLAEVFQSLESEHRELSEGKS